MNYLKSIFAGKSFGFYVTLATMAFSVITAVIYAVMYGNSSYISWAGVVIMLAGVLIGVVLIVLRKSKFVPAVMLVSTLVGILLYIYNIYFYVSVVIVGIQASEFSAEFFVATIMFAISFVAATACVFLPQERNIAEIKNVDQE